MKKNDIEVSYACGMLHGRRATIDSSSGVYETVAGVDYRCRVSKIVSCEAEEAGVIVLTLEGEEEPVGLIGSMKGFDEVVKRAEMRENK